MGSNIPNLQIRIFIGPMKQESLSSQCNQCLITLSHSFGSFPLGTAGSNSNSTWYYELSVLNFLEESSPSSSLVLLSASGNTCLTYLTTFQRPVATGLVFSGTFQGRCPRPLKRLSRISRSSPGESHCFYSL
jgi:hypothetical protein